MKRLVSFLTALCAVILMTVPVFAASQDHYELPEPYLAWEKAYLPEFPELQPVMDVMLEKTAQQLEKPEQDRLHHVLGVLPAAQSVIGHPIDHVAIGLDRPAELLLCQSRSPPWKSLFERPFIM